MLCFCTLCPYATCEWPEFYVNKIMFCSVFEPLIVLMKGATNKSLFFTVNGFNPKLSALKINFNYLMPIFLGF